MKIGLIDADLLGRKNHRFPNLALMKISSYYKRRGCDTNLLLNYNNLDKYDKVFLSRAFTDAKIPIDLNRILNLEYGGTGFFLENAPALDYEIEHSFPDYNLYKDWVSLKISEGISPKKLKYYTDYSIGFTTRGCFRKCDFCVNKNSDRVELHSPIDEFLNQSKKSICLLDDNFLGYHNYKEILLNLIETKKKFQFKQGLDLRILTEEACELLSKCKYDGDFIFAFDNIKDYDLIEKKLKLWRSYTHKNTKLYLLVAYESQDMEDIINMFERIKLLMEYKCVPYIMRYESFKTSKFRRLYTNVSRWCNQPALFKKMSFEEFCIAHGENHGVYKMYLKYKKDYPDLAQEYFEMKYH
jgi:hypothetical protein